MPAAAFAWSARADALKEAAQATATAAAVNAFMSSLQMKNC
jgi:hypothetical protein